MKNVLFLAFQYPPFSASSAVQRASRFSRYLVDYGWSPHVVTAHVRAYERIEPTKDVLPASVGVTRAFALDAQRHLAINGRFFRISALPDRWVSWALGAIPTSVYWIYRKKVDVILVTFPLATTVLIGLVLQVLTRKPLVVDFRDSMTEEDYPRDAFTRRVWVWIERNVMKRGSRFIFTTPSAREMYLKRYPKLRPEDFVVIANGYDENDFLNIDTTRKQSGEPFRLLHSGVIYPDERDPRAFFRAIQRLKRDGRINFRTVGIDLRATGSDNYYRDLLKQLGIEDIVKLLPSISHQEAVQDIADADALLLFQGASCNHQIPGKVYEYLRSGKPILALTSTAGDTATLLQETGGATIADLANEDAIYAALDQFLESLRQGTHPTPDQRRVQRYTRKNGTQQLAHVLDSAVGLHSSQSGAVPNEAAR